MQEELIRKPILPFTVPCSNLNHCSEVCSTSECLLNAIICQQPQCQCHNHKACNQKISWVQLNDSILNQQHNLSQQTKVSFEMIEKLYDEMIEEMSQQRAKFIDFVQMYGLKPNAMQLVNWINQGSYQNLTGDYMNRVVKQIKQQQKIQYHVSVDSIMRISEIERQQFKLISNKLKRFRSEPSLNTLSSMIDKQQQSILMSFFPKQVKAFQLLYRGSENNFRSSKFHQLCDGVTDTLVIVLTQYGKKIGGYTPLPWKYIQWGHSEDQSSTSFLFSLTLKEKYLVTKQKLATSNQKWQGPIFGPGHDLMISDRCHEYNSSYAKFGIGYNLLQQSDNGFNQFNYKYKGCQQTYTDFCGAPQGCKFKVNQYEVFKVHFKNI